MRAMICLAVLLTAAAACGGDDDTPARDDAGPTPDSKPPPDAMPDDSDAGTAILPETLPDPLPSGDVAATFATYNVGLLQTIKFQTERKPLAVAALKTLDADIVCIQEVWNEVSSPLDLATLLSAEFPYSMWTWAADTGFGNGVLIVSKVPLFRGRAIKYAENPSDFVTRVLVTATAVSDDYHVHVMCSHIEAFTDPEFQAAREAQVAEAEQFAIDQGYAGSPTVFMGDFNTGPETDGGCSPDACTMGVDTTTFADLITRWTGAVEHVGDNVTAEDGLQCTYCQDFAKPLQLIPPTDIEPNQRIDHILYQDFGASEAASCEILFEDEVTYTAGGGDFTSQRSDHRGVQCVFGAP